MKNEISFCVSMSTIPRRIDNINEILNKINEQTLKPKQILVEFDELTVPSKKGFDRVTKVNKLLIKS